MARGLRTGNPAVEAAFRSVLWHQALLVLLIGAALGLAYSVVRTVTLHRMAAPGRIDSPPVAMRQPPVAMRQPPARVEAPARRLVRSGFGALWILDGLLQTQASMPIGLPTQVIVPSETGQPHLVASLINWGAVVWQHHPLDAASAVVWLEIGLGAWLLMSSRGRLSRAAGAASAFWAVVVWAFGEGFGGLLTSSSSWLFGAPGAAVFYAVAGGLIAAPQSVWESPRAGRALLKVMGVVFVGCAVLQSIPGRGLWDGSAVSEMAHQMSALRQPGITRALVRHFGALSKREGGLLNGVVVASLALSGAGLASGRAPRASLALATSACLVSWVLVQDLGVFGGLGTDPNSGPPMILLLAVGYVALRPARARVPESSRDG